jgi:hypothetical protein
MKKLQVHTDPRVHEVFDTYPAHVRKKILDLRGLIIETAEGSEDIDQMEETLKWGEPSYLVKKGSTVRIDWKPKYPDQYAIYFKCTSLLVHTFKKVFKGKFNFEGNRAIIFHMGEKIPERELKDCIKAALRYHKVKQLPTLGM